MGGVFERGEESDSVAGKVYDRIKLIDVVDGEFAATEKAGISRFACGVEIGGTAEGSIACNGGELL
jgi:hypothetical protein